jgi:hypothetical protein
MFYESRKCKSLEPQIERFESYLIHSCTQIESFLSCARFEALLWKSNNHGKTLYGFLSKVSNLF